MKVVSLFSGIGGLDLGFERAGFEIVAHVEFNPQCKKLLAAKWPKAVYLKDVRDAGKHNLPTDVDGILAGFPCQDVSIAGKRAGFKSAAGITRSGLFYQLVRIADELRPTFLVWENVPGLLSSDEGRDFARVIVELEGIGYRGAWRCFDAQYFGVAQSRRRVFGVFTRGDIGAERCAEILSIPEGMRGHPAPSRKARQVTPAIPSSGAGTSRTGNERTEAGFCVETVGALQARDFKGVGSQYVDEGKDFPFGADLTKRFCCPKCGLRFGVNDEPEDAETNAVTCPKCRNIEHLHDGMTDSIPDICGTFLARPTSGGWSNSADMAAAGYMIPAVTGTLTDAGGHSAGSATSQNAYSGQLLPIAECYPIDTRNATRTTDKSEQNRQGLGVGKDGDPCGTLTGLFTPAVAMAISFDGLNQAAHENVTPPLRVGRDSGDCVAFNWQSGGDCRIQPNDERANTLSVHQTQAVAFQPGNLLRQAGANPSTENFPTLGAKTVGDQFPHVAYYSGVRRLTPRECERLQGFQWRLDGPTMEGAWQDEFGRWWSPDWTEGFADGPRYRMLGNAVAVPCAEWIAKRIAKSLA